MNDGASTTKGAMKLDHRSHNHMVYNAIGTISERSQWFSDRHGALRKAFELIWNYIFF